MKNVDWLGKIKGAKKAAELLAKEQKANRQKAVNLLSEATLKSGKLDVAKVLITSLGGKNRELTTKDLSTFKRNLKQAAARFGANSGITAQQIIDLASSNALYYKSFKPLKSDLDKAKKEITSALAVSANKGQIRFITNASKDYGAIRHYVTIELTAYNAAHTKLLNAGNDPQKIKQIANWLRKQPLKFDCDCGRHQYFFRYLATIGGFNLGRKETAYPKQTNAGLRGVACKHVLRCAAEVQSSNIFLNFLTKHLTSSKEYKAHSQLTQKEASQTLKAKKTATKIKTTMQRELLKQVAAKNKAQREQKAQKPLKLSTTKLNQALQNGKITKSELATFKKFNLSDAQILKLLKKS